MTQTRVLAPANIPRDLTSGMVVFFVAVPLCLGVALASNAPLISGVVAGVVGGILVGLFSGSHTSVSGPAAGLTAVIAAQIATLGSFEAVVLAVAIAGTMQIALGVAKAGFLSAFLPSAVINGLLTAIGVILILKQIPHLVGHDADPEGEMSFIQPDHENTFSEFGELLGDVHPGAALIGIVSLLFLVFWDKCKPLKKSIVPSQLLVVVMGVGLSALLSNWGVDWAIGVNHLVQVPVAGSLPEFWGLLPRPDFSQLSNPAVYTSALTIAIVASLESLMNLEAADKLDPRQRNSPSSRELIAQGVGNVASGMLGGLPVTSVVVRSSVNIAAGAKSKLSTIVHGSLLLVCVTLVPVWLNKIPLSCLAAILLVSGFKLASPAVWKRMWSQGRYQFVPFAVTVAGIVFTDLLIGTLVGLVVSMSFILNSNLRRSIRRFEERHLSGDVLHVELANQVSFLNRAALMKVLDGVPRGGHVLLDAQQTDYIDPDVQELIREFKEITAPARGVQVSLLGFRSKYRLEDQIQYVDYATRELQSSLTPVQALQYLKEGHERFRSGNRLTRDLARQVNATAQGQHPVAVILSCIDSRAPVELIFDLGVGDVFSVRIAGNITSRKVLGSMEYACAVAGAKLVLVMGHTSCGAVTAAVQLSRSAQSVAQATGCQHVEHLLGDIQESMERCRPRRSATLTGAELSEFADEVSRANVERTVEAIVQQSDTLRGLVEAGRIAIVGSVYDVNTGVVKFLTDEPTVLSRPKEPSESLA